MKSTWLLCWLAAALWGAQSSFGVAQSSAAEPAVDLWQLAQREKGTHRFSTLFTAQNVRDLLANDAGLAAAVELNGRKLTVAARGWQYEWK